MKAKLKTARAVADLGEGVVMARVEIGAAPDRVFRALTTDELTKWWGADGVYHDALRARPASRGEMADRRRRR